MGCECGGLGYGSGSGSRMDAGMSDPLMQDLLQLIMDLQGANGDHRGNHLDPRTQKDLQKLLADLKKSHGHSNNPKIQKDLQKLLSDLQGSQGNHGGHHCDGDNGDGNYTPVSSNPDSDCSGDSNDNYTPVSYRNTDNHNAANTIDKGSLDIWGDPHIKGTGLEVNGREVKFDEFTTQGGVNQNITLLDTDSLDITAKFEQRGSNSNVTVVGKETITAGDEDITIDASMNTVEVEGEKLTAQQLQDGYHTHDGTTIKKSGDQITIETADGQKITVTDKGNYLDTHVEFDKLRTDRLDGMLGDLLEGTKNADATDYLAPPKANDEHGHGNGANPVSYHGGHNQQGADWAIQVLSYLIQGLPNSDLKSTLVALVNYIQNSNGPNHHHRYSGSVMV